MQVVHPLYKHLLKHVAAMGEILICAQPYIQLEDAMKISSATPQGQAMVEGSRNLLAKLPTLQTDTGGSLLIGGKHSRSPPQTRCEVTDRWTTSPH